MGRHCERPGCTRPAEATYSIDVGRLLVVIERWDQADAGSAGLLCLRHASTMSAPRNWTVDDRRLEMPTLFPAPAGPRRPARRAGVSTARNTVGEQLRLVVDNERPGTGAAPDLPAAPVAPSAASSPPTDDDVVVDPDETRMLAWQPKFDAGDLDGLLQARGPLLARAFGQRRARR